MTSRTKEQTRALKGPDQFQVQVMSGLDWVVKHAKQLVPVALLLALAAGGVLAYQKYQSSQRGSRLEELGKVQIVYEGEERMANDQREVLQKQIEAIDAKVVLPAAKPGEPEAPPPAMDPAQTAQKAVLEKQVAAIKADHTESSRQFQEYFKKYEKTPEGWVAGMTAAKIMLDGQKTAEATPLVEAVVANSKDVPFYQTQARLTLAGLHEEAGAYDKALVELDALDKIVSEELKPKVLLARGRIQLLKDQKAEAKTTFDGLIEKHGASPEAQKARSIQALFN